MSEFGDFSETHSSASAPRACAKTGEGKRRLRLWMVDDHAPLRRGIAQWLDADAGIRVVQQFDSAKAMLGALSDERPPDVILLDLNIGKENGLLAIEPIKKLAPAVKVLMFTTFTNTFAENEAFRLGASGFLLKIYEPQEIVGLIYQSVYHPEDPELFPNINRRSGLQNQITPKGAMPREGAER